jgi:hypothetical protein
MSQQFKIIIFNPLDTSKVLFEGEWCKSISKGYEELLTHYPDSTITLSVLGNVYLGRNKKAGRYIKIQTKTSELGKKTLDELVLLCKELSLSPIGNKDELTHKIIEAKRFTTLTTPNLRLLCEEWCLSIQGSRCNLIKRLIKNKELVLTSEEDIPNTSTLITIFVFGKWDKRSKQLLPRYKKMMTEKGKTPYSMSVDNFTSDNYVKEDDNFPLLLFIKNGRLSRKNTQINDF